MFVILELILNTSPPIISRISILTVLVVGKLGANLGK